MTSAAEAVLTPKSGSLAADLAVGTDAISSNQKITFTKYVKLVLPLDGYVFWVKADLVSQSALFNAATLNSVAFNEAAEVLVSAPSFEAKGSLHYATTAQQGSEATYSVNQVNFTSEVPINDLSKVGPHVLYIGTFQGKRFAFRQRRSFYKQADLYHYVGDAVYPIMESQLIDDMSDISARSLIVSNSLPIWLSMNLYTPKVYEPFRNTAGMLYPSYLVDENIDPPFAAVDIPPESTVALASAPQLGRRLSHSQLASDDVKITLWGLDNDAALDFADFVNQFSLNRGLIGIMNVPVVRDEKQTQVELGTIAKKKTIRFKVSYQQAAARDIARQLIESAIPTYLFN